MGQLWFIGFLLKILATPLLEKFGYLFILKTVIIPMNILSFQLQYLPDSYLLRCIGFLMSGFCRLKTVPCLLLIKDIVSEKNDSITSTLYYSMNFSVVAIFCFYIEYISKDAIAFLHFTNVICILSAAVVFSIGVDSPKRCL